MGLIIIEVPDKVEIRIKAKNLEEAVELLKEKIEEHERITLAQYFLKKYGGKLLVDIKEDD